MNMKKLKLVYYSLSTYKMKRVLHFTIFILPGVLLLSCSGSIPEPTITQVERASQRWPGTNSETLAQGRQIYVTKCSGCHSVKVPSRYSEVQWDTLMRTMGTQAKLNKDEYEKILHYVFMTSKEKRE